MTYSLRRQRDFEDHTTRWLLRNEEQPAHFNFAPSIRLEEDFAQSGAAPYSTVEDWRGQLEQIPSGEELLTLARLLRTEELREALVGLVIDTRAACQAESLPEVAAAVNGWVATAEEMAMARRKLRHIIAARERMSRQAQDN